MLDILDKTPINRFKIGILSLFIESLSIDKFCQKLWEDFANESNKA